MGNVNDHIAAALANPAGSINDKLIAFFSALYGAHAGDTIIFDGTVWGASNPAADSVLTGTFAAVLKPTPVKTANYAAVASDLVPCDTTGGSFTVTLPAAPADKTRLAIKLIAGTNPLNFACAGADVFNKAGGATTGSLTLLNQAINLQYLASAAIWYVVADDLPLSSLQASLASTFAPLAGIVFAAAPTGVAATDTANLQAALNALTNGGVCQLQRGQYVTNAALTIPVADITIRGSQALSKTSTSSATWIVNAASDIFSFTGTITGLVIEDLGLNSQTGGGHIFNAATAGFSRNRFRRLALVQGNAAKSIFFMSAGSLGKCTFEDISESVAATSTVPAWSIQGAGGTINTSQWERIEHTSGSSSVNYVFDIEETGTLLISDLIFRDIVMEQTNGGCIKLVSAANCLIDHVDVFDLASVGATVADLFVIDKAATGLISKFNMLRQINRHGGALGTNLVDIRLGTNKATLTTIQSCGQQTLSGFVIDLGSNTDIAIRGGHSSDTYQNLVLGNTIIENNGSLRLGPVMTKRLASISAVTYEAFPRLGCPTANMSPLTSGRLVFQAIELLVNTVVTNITFHIGTTAATLPTNWWFGLWKKDGTQLALTADQTTAALAGSSLKTVALTVPFTITASDIYYLSIMVAATVVPTLAGLTALFTAGDLPVICGQDATHTGLTDPSTAPPTATITGVGQQIWCGVA